MIQQKNNNRFYTRIIHFRRLLLQQLLGNCKIKYKRLLLQALPSCDTSEAQFKLIFGAQLT